MAISPASPGTSAVSPRTFYLRKSLYYKRPQKYFADYYYTYGGQDDFFCNYYPEEHFGMSMYQCYGLLDERGRWRAWRFGPATSDEHARLVHEAGSARQVLFGSVQKFVPPQSISGTTHWRKVREYYTGENALEHFAPLYFDIDCEDDPAKALLWARSLLEFFTSELNLPEPAVRVWFSGSKGVHLIVDPVILGIQPGATLTADIKLIALEMVKQLAALGTPDLTIDPVVYSLPRMIRMPDQLNPRSGLYKVELSHTELLELSAQQIKELASKPRGELYKTKDLPDSPIPKAAGWWAKALESARQPREFRIKTAHLAGLKVRPDGYLVDKLQHESMPSCIKGIINSVVSPGSRNRCELQLACWAKAARIPLDKALDILQTWTTRNRPELSGHNASLKAQSILRSVYDNTSYGFSCAASRSAARSVVIPDCSQCHAVRPQALRLLSSLRVSHDRHWTAPKKITLEESRGLIAAAIDKRVARAGALSSANRTVRKRQDPRRPAGPGQAPKQGRVCDPDARAGHTGTKRSSKIRCPDSLLAAGAGR